MTKEEVNQFIDRLVKERRMHVLDIYRVPFEEAIQKLEIIRDEITLSGDKK